VLGDFTFMGLLVRGEGGTKFSPLVAPEGRVTLAVLVGMYLDVLLFFAMLFLS